MLQWKYGMMVGTIFQSGSFQKWSRIENSSETVNTRVFLSGNFWKMGNFHIQENYMNKTHI